MGENKLLTVICCPHDLYWASEVEVQLNNFRRVGFDSEVHFLVFVEGEFRHKPYWDQMVERYTDVKFFFYRDDDIKNLLAIYQSVSRPNCLKKHWAAYPELQDRVILYMDSDVLFSSKPDFSPYMDDSICYLSKTNYISPSYFSDKRKDVYPFRLKEYDKRDILQELCDIVGVDKDKVVYNEPYTGGCQYILKGIDQQFWVDLEQHCVRLRMHSMNINAEFFPNEDRGLQSWAIGDMCGLLWNLWKRNKVVRTPDYMDFSWSTNPIEEYNKHVFFHNAGVVAKEQELDGRKVRLFHKGDIRFRTSTITFFDLTSWGDISPDYCSIKYLEEIAMIKEPICRTQSLVY